MRLPMKEASGNFGQRSSQSIRVLQRGVIGEGGRPSPKGGADGGPLPKLKHMVNQMGFRRSLERVKRASRPWKGTATGASPP